MPSILGLLAALSLVGAGVVATHRGLATREARATWLVRLAAALQTTALVCRAVAAQWAWGSWWRYDPVECWGLVPLLGIAALCTTLARRGWRGRAPRVLVWVVAGLALAVTLGALPLVRALGLPSLYTTITGGWTA